MTDDSFKGTGDLIGEVDFGFGVLKVFDDGYEDSDVTVQWADDDSDDRGILDGFARARYEHGDETVKAVLDATDAPAAAHTTTTKRTPVSFKCDGCRLTWPWKDNQTPNDSQDMCPQCW